MHPLIVHSRDSRLPTYTPVWVLVERVRIDAPHLPALPSSPPAEGAVADPSLLPRAALSQNDADRKGRRVQAMPPTEPVAASLTLH